MSISLMQTEWLTINIPQGLANLVIKHIKFNQLTQGGNMIVLGNLLMFILLSCTCVFMAKVVPDEYAKINKRIDDLMTKQQTIYKYHLFSLLAQMRDSKTLAIMQENYELAGNIQKSIEELKEILKDYEEKTNS